MTTPDFRTVVDRIEEKALRQRSEEIYKLKMMKEKRTKADAPFINELDKFVITANSIDVIDSSKIIGAQALLKCIIRWKEEKAERLRKAQEVVESRESGKLE